MKKSKLYTALFILSLIAFISGTVCILFRNMTHNDLFTIIGGGCFLCGILVLIFFLVFSAKQSNSGSGIDMNKYEKLLSGIKDAMYGDDDEGKPEISVTSPLLGKFIYRRKPEWYEAECDWCGCNIKVTFENDNKCAPEDCLSELETVFKHSKNIDRTIRKMAAKELRDLQKTHKCPDELLQTRPAVFAKRLVPSNIHLSENGEDSPLEICYFDAPVRSECNVIAYGECVHGITRVEISKIILKNP